MGLLGDISLGYLQRKREVEDKEAEDSFQQNKQSIGNLSKLWQSALEGARQDPEVQREIWKRIGETSNLDPRDKNASKKISKLADMSILWQGVKRSPESMQPREQQMSAQVQQPSIPLPKPPGMEGGAALSTSAQMPQMNLESTIPLPAPPTDYLSVYPSEQEISMQQYADAESKQQRELSGYRSKKAIDQEFATDAGGRFASFGGDGIFDQATGEVIIQPTEKAGATANLQRVNGRIKGTKDPIIAGFNPQTGAIMYKGKDITDQFEQIEEPGNEPLVPVVQGNRVIYTPRSQAAGLDAPRTIYDVTGMPSVAGQVGMSTSAPPTIDATTQQSLTGWKVAIDSIDKEVLPAIKRLQSSFGPIIGRIKNVQIANLGGWGTTPEEKKLALDLRRLLMSQAFAEGGKQLTDTEKIEFQATSPNLSDTVENAIIKAEGARNYLQNRYNQRINTMPVNQRRQVSPLAPPNPPIDTIAAPSGNRTRIKVQP